MKKSTKILIGIGVLVLIGLLAALFLDPSLLQGRLRGSLSTSPSYEVVETDTSGKTKPGMGGLSGSSESSESTEIDIASYLLTASSEGDSSQSYPLSEFDLSAERDEDPFSAWSTSWAEIGEFDLYRKGDSACSSYGFTAVLPRRSDGLLYEAPLYFFVQNLRLLVESPEGTVIERVEGELEGSNYTIDLPRSYANMHLSLEIRPSEDAYDFTYVNSTYSKSIDIYVNRLCADGKTGTLTWEAWEDENPEEILVEKANEYGLKIGTLIFED